MPEQLAAYITQYGYYAIFSLIFLQELGVPNPVPNELVLLFSGYLATIGALSFPLVFLAAVGADFIGTSVLFFVFYFFGQALLRKPRRWLPISREKILSLSAKLSEKGRWGLYVGRLVPYMRGYISVAAGFAQIRPATFVTTIILSALTWSGGYAILGFILGPYWEQVVGKIGYAQGFVALIMAGLVVFFALKYIRRSAWWKRRKTATSDLS